MVCLLWNDNRSPEGRTRETLVDKICATAEARGGGCTHRKEGAW